MGDAQNMGRGSESGSGAFKSGYVPVDDDYLQQSGLRGCKSCCLCVLIVVLLLVALLNALVTAGLVYFLSITHEGMTTLEFFPDGKYVRALADIHADTVNVQAGLVGPPNKDLVFPAEEISVGISDGTNIHMVDNDTVITTGNFRLLSLDGSPYFSDNGPLQVDRYEVKNLYASALEVGSLRSKAGVKDIILESSNNASLVGMEGVEVKAGKNIKMVAERSIHIMSLDGHITFKQEEGLFLEESKLKDMLSDRGSQSQYKLCVCVPSGRVFAVYISGRRSGCHTVNEDTHPCLE